ncbi:galactose residue biosynthesis protein Pvg2 [Schizosaccharomyces japonicus yFS275]|uniref:Galactose residue biosynthesis protein Pvg2 n=1 Tax=Schizosaccharomyces japonicus (strain yFS275 / FY16936) TaxID=402676 RepID=B6K802_SCHJY|nr:galactose residue biosynthesis protein Pvg2 [Schizosaccharomyces japonicus yFS275]EEB09656.1 galactose residue biosynthesis protein Pvg2 [Schizosaccharomyces japonicus yFS275]
MFQPFARFFLTKKGTINWLKGTVVVIFGLGVFCYWSYLYAKGGNVDLYLTYWPDEVLDNVLEPNLTFFEREICVKQQETGAGCKHLGIEPTVMGDAYMSQHDSEQIQVVFAKWNNKIPRVVHGIGRSDEAPVFTEFEVNWRMYNPSCPYVFWLFEHLEPMVRKYQPAYAAVFNRLTPEGKRQLGSLLGLYEFGGIWVDRSVELFKGLETILQLAENDTTIVGGQILRNGTMDAKFSSSSSSLTNAENKETIFHQILLGPELLGYGVIAATPRNPLVLQMINDYLGSIVPPERRGRLPLRSLSEYARLEHENPSVVVNGVVYTREVLLYETGPEKNDEDLKILGALKLKPRTYVLPQNSFSSGWNLRDDFESSDICFYDFVVFDPPLCARESLKLSGKEWGIRWSTTYEVMYV